MAQTKTDKKTKFRLYFEDTQTKNQFQLSKGYFERLAVENRRSIRRNNRDRRIIQLRAYYIRAIFPIIRLVVLTV
jgi:hypothetical protein